MLGSLLVALAVAAGPEPASVGSVEGPFAWVDLHGAYGWRTSPAPGAPLMDTTRMLGALQLQGFVGWGLPLLGSHLAVSASALGTLLPGSLDPSGSGPTSVVPSPVQVAASLPLATAELALVPGLAVAVPTQGWPRPLFEVRPSLEARWAVVEGLLLGARVDVTLPLNPPDETGPQFMFLTTVPRRCELDAPGCGQSQLHRRWAAGLRLQAEYAVLPTLSVVGRVALGLDDTLWNILVASSSAPDAPVYRPAWLGLSARPAVEVHWAFAGSFGLTAGLAMDAGRDLDRYLAWQAHLSLWFRTDPHLRRAWLER